MSACGPQGYAADDMFHSSLYYNAALSHFVNLCHLFAVIQKAKKIHIHTLLCGCGRSALETLYLLAVRAARYLFEHPFR